MKDIAAVLNKQLRIIDKGGVWMEEIKKITHRKD